MEPTAQCHTTKFSEYLRSREQLIAAQAEWYWLMRGCPDGSPELDWFRAEAEIDQEFLSQIDLGIAS